MESILILVKLICAHILADFMFQTDAINSGKRLKGIRSVPYQLLHSFIHAITAFVLLADWGVWFIPLIIFVSHFVIDILKCKYGKGLISFLIDQFAHIAVIVLLWYGYFAPSCDAVGETFAAPNFWLTLSAYLLMWKPASILLDMFLKQWTPDISKSQSLPNAGQWIGFLERTLILTFVLIGSLEGVGFLLAAKSVFCFGELTKAKEIKITEYVMIGTLSSFVLALLVGISVKYVLKLFP